jgi:class 3 adenylate cyclase
MDQLMNSLIHNAITYCKRGINAGLSSAIELATPVLASRYGYPVFAGQSRSQSSHLNRRLVGILYADIVEYSRLTEEDEEGTHLRLVETMKIMTSHVTANHGRVAHFAGDAILAEFKDADSALHCAINMQLATLRQDSELDANHQVRFRIGVNFGDVITEEGDIYGKAVNLAARLESLASTGGICVSDIARSNLTSQSRCKFVSMGKRHVKNISETEEVFRIVIDAQQVEDIDLTSAVKLSAVAS